MFESKELLKKVDYLESEREKLWERIIRLEKEVKESATSHERDAKQASKKAAEYRKKCVENFPPACPSANFFSGTFDFKSESLVTSSSKDCSETC